MALELFEEQDELHQDDLKNRIKLHELHQDDLKEKDEFIRFFKIVQGKIASAAGIE